jgi:hypothetical protein
MSSTVGETAVSVNGQTAGQTSDEPVKVGVKRKRTPSTEEQESESTKIGLVNGAVENSRSEGGEVRERVAILDAGAQYGKVIDRRVRELCVESVLLPLDTSADQLVREGYR